MAELPPTIRKFFNEVARPAAESLTLLKAEYDMARASGFITELQATLESLPDREVLDDGRADEGAQQLTKEEAIAGLALIGLLSNAVNGDAEGVAALAKLRVRPLTMR